MIPAMIASLRHFLGRMVSAFRSREDLVLENLALHQQLLTLHAQRPRRRKIKARTSLLTHFRPPTRLTLKTHAQYRRNPARCQFRTVRGVTKTRGFFHPDQNARNA